MTTTNPASWGVRGHERAIAFLKKSLERGMLAHAYLFVGPQGVGKLDLALGLAKAITCPSEAKPCLTCKSCTRIKMGTHTDVRVVTRTGASVGIEQVRIIQQNASLKPFEGFARVFIIDGAEAMTRDAANALLKLLEEPPPYVYLLLLTSDETAVPETVLSRCQRVTLLPFSQDEVVASLEEQGLAADQARDIARLTRGRITLAEEMARSPEALAERRERIRDLMGMTKLTKTERLKEAERMAAGFSRNRDGLFNDLALLTEGWRDLLLQQAGLGNLALDPQLLPEKAPYPVEEIAGTLERLELSVQALRANVNARLVLEALLLAMPDQPVG